MDPHHPDTVDLRELLLANETKASDTAVNEHRQMATAMRNRCVSDSKIRCLPGNSPKRTSSFCVAGHSTGPGIVPLHHFDFITFTTAWEDLGYGSVKVTMNKVHIYDCEHDAYAPGCSIELTFN